MLNLFKTFIFAFFAVSSFSIQGAEASSSSSSASERDGADQESPSASASPLKFVNFASHRALIISLGKANERRVPYVEAFDGINSFLIPDSVAFGKLEKGREVCRFEELGSERCAALVDALPVTQLNELLGHILVYVNQAPRQGSALTHFKRCLATAEASLRIFVTASDAVQSSAGRAADKVARYNSKDAARQAAYDAWSSGPIAAAVSAFRKATRVYAWETHKSMTYAECAPDGGPVRGAIYPAHTNAIDTATRTAGEAAVVLVSENGTPQEIGQQAYNLGELASLAFLVKNAVRHWHISLNYSALRNTLHEYEIPAAPFLAAWTAEDRQDAFLAPYIRVIDAAEKDFTDAYALEAEQRALLELGALGDLSEY